jgi:hypothetical protein
LILLLQTLDSRLDCKLRGTTGDRNEWLAGVCLARSIERLDRAAERARRLNQAKCFGLFADQCRAPFAARIRLAIREPLLQRRRGASE